MKNRRSDSNRFQPIELWGGIECTVNRVRDDFFDQLEWSGHSHRLSDLDLIAGLGIKTLRYPVLWEKVAPDSLSHLSWDWTDSRLGRLRELGIAPVVGLLHHGSGPRYTSLLDPEFPEKFALFAGKVAERYPWVNDYIPVNEPLTTARFSTLYGHWYPHERSDSAFARAFLNQCQGVAGAMKAIRRVNPRARLVQTEDLGKVFSTPALAYQADFENVRRWSTWDMLTGRVDRRHPLYGFLHASGIAEAELDAMADNACPPDVLGVNHYVTSHRYLDERLDMYPPHTHGGNAFVPYADVEAVRVCPNEGLRPEHLFREVWDRYGIPIVVTEAHLGSTREEQLRWLKEIWKSSETLRRDGVEIRAVTAWALLGSFNWNSLVTRNDGHYEPGAFCLRGGHPRPTAISSLLTSLAKGRAVDHPGISGEGWWRREDRLFHPPERRGEVKPDEGTFLAPRPLLIIGATGTLGQALARTCEQRGLRYEILGRKEVDIASEEQVSFALARVRPWAVINAAGYVRIDAAEQDAARCFRENVFGATCLAQHCAELRIPLVTFSTDQVFDGLQITPYVESSPSAPLNIYGHSKAEAETKVLERHPGALVVRTSAFFGPWDNHNFVRYVLNRIACHETVMAASDEVVSPTYVPHLANATLDLLLDGESGLWHIANGGQVSWAELAHTIGKMANRGEVMVRALPLQQLAPPAARPKFSALSSERGNFLPHWKDALAEFLRAVG